ncbi:hypothetical protein CsSME_00038458 [Camellia sinensis var. sinensis]
MTVFTFNNTILLRSPWTYKLLKNTSMIKMRMKNSGNIFSTIIRTDISNNCTKLSLNHLQKLSKNGKHVRLMMEQIYPSASSVVTNKGDVISMARKSINKRRIPNIGMYEVQSTRNCKAQPILLLKTQVLRRGKLELYSQHR